MLAKSFRSVGHLAVVFSSHYHPCCELPLMVKGNSSPNGVESLAPEDSRSFHWNSIVEPPFSLCAVAVKS